MAVTRPAGVERVVRRRRSALQTPAFVDRMDLADDAEGRVAIFSVEETADPMAPGADAWQLAAAPPPRARAGPWVDGPYTALAVAVALAVVLILGLLLLRR